MLTKDIIDKRTNRHVGRCMQRLDEISTPEIVKDTIKAVFWTLASDLKCELDNVGETKNVKTLHRNRKMER